MHAHVFSKLRCGQSITLAAKQDMSNHFTRILIRSSNQFAYTSVKYDLIIRSSRLRYL